MNKKAIHTDDAPAAIGTYSQAIQAGEPRFPVRTNTACAGDDGSR